MPRALGFWVLMRVSWVWLRWVVSDFGHADSRRVVPGGGWLQGWRGGSSCGAWRCQSWSGWHAGEGDDGRRRPGGGVRAAGAGEGAGAFGLAGAVPVPVDDRAVLREFAGQRGVAGSPGADRGGDGAAGAAVGDLAGLDRLPCPAALPRGGGGEGGGPGGEFLADQARAAGAEHRPG